MDKSAFLSRFGQLKVHPCEIDGQTFHVRTMSVAERSAMERSISDGGKVKNEAFRERLLAWTLCDEAGVRLFKDSDFAEISALSAELEPLVEKAMAVNGYSTKSQDDARKN